MCEFRDGCKVMRRKVYMGVALVFAESVLGIGSDCVSIPEALVVISR